MGAHRRGKMGGPCGVKKGKSNKMKLHRKYREEKLVRQHHKKLKKVARKARQAGVKAPQRRDPGIPNSMPFKDEFLREAAEHKERVASERDKRIAQQKADRKRKLAAKRNATIQDLASEADKRSNAFNVKNSGAPAEDDGVKDLAGKQKKAQYMRQLREVVAMSDIVLVVLDARNPIGCRCKSLEELVMQSGTEKRIVLILNKIDLVPRGVVQA